MKLTPLFNGTIKPVRVGVYQQTNGNGEFGYQRWDGQFWYGWSSTINGAESMEIKALPHCQNDPWRGLAEDPNK